MPFNLTLYLITVPVPKFTHDSGEKIMDQLDAVGAHLGLYTQQPFVNKMFKFLLGYQVLIEGIIPGIGVPEPGFGNQVFLDESPGLLRKVFCALFVKLGKNCRTCSL